MQNIDEMTMYQICLLHARADRAVRSLVSGQLEQYQLTMMEWLLLGVVCDGPPEGMSMSAVAQSLDVTLPQVTALTNKLLTLKLVKQKTQTHDRRSRHIKPTGKGVSLVEDVEESVRKVITEWVEDLPRDQRLLYVETVGWLATHRHGDPSAKA